MELQITMLGPRGVGKTTLLTAMYDQFESTVGRTDLQLTPDDESAALLGDNLGNLKQLLIDPQTMEGIAHTPILADPSALPIFRFGIGKKASPPSLWLKFRDYPGGYIGVRATTEQRAYVSGLLRESHVVLIAIDAAPLMERNGDYNDTFNRPVQIKPMFANAYQDLDSPRLVLFVPVKCEKYASTQEGAQKLRQKIKESYASTFEFFANDKLRSKVAAVITPVQTVGSIVFSRLQVQENPAEPVFIYRKTSFDARYRPLDSEQPLRYLLSFLLKLHYAQRSEGFWGWIRMFFRLDEHLLRAAREFAKGCKRSGGFEVVQGAELLLGEGG